MSDGKQCRAARESEKSGEMKQRRWPGVDSGVAKRITQLLIRVEGGEETLIWLMINEWTATEIRVGQFRLQRRNRSLSIEENRVPLRVSTSSSRCFEPFRDG